MSKGIFTAEDFSGVDMSSEGGKTTRTRFGPSPRQAENIAAAANARLAPLIEALDKLDADHGDHNDLDDLLERVDSVVTAHRALKGEEKT